MQYININNNDFQNKSLNADILFGYNGTVRLIKEDLLYLTNYQVNDSLLSISDEVFHRPNKVTFVYDGHMMGYFYCSDCADHPFIIKFDIFNSLNIRNVTYSSGSNISPVKLEVDSEQHAFSFYLSVEQAKYVNEKFLNQEGDKFLYDKYVSFFIIA